MTTKIDRLVKESRDLASNDSLAVVSHYFDLYLIDLLIQTNYDDKQYIASLLDKVEATESDLIKDTDKNILLQQMVKFCVIIYKKNVDLSKQVFGTDHAHINVADLVQSIWLNIDLVECLVSTFDAGREDVGDENRDLLVKFDGEGKLKTLKLMLKRVLQVPKEAKSAPEECEDEGEGGDVEGDVEGEEGDVEGEEGDVEDVSAADEALLNQQLSRFDSRDEEKEEEDAPEFEEDDEEDAPEFEEDDEEDAPEFENNQHQKQDSAPPNLCKTSRSSSSLKLPTPPDFETTTKPALITQNITAASSDSDYNSSEISDIITTQETIDGMVKLAKIGIQCIQYEDLQVAKETFAQLVGLLSVELEKGEK